MKLFRKLPLSLRMTLMIVAGTGIIFAAIMLYSYLGVRGIIFENTSERNKIMAEWIAERISHELTYTEQIVRTAAEELTLGSGSSEQCQTLMTRAMNAHPGAIAMAYTRIDPEKSAAEQPPAYYISRNAEMTLDSYTFGIRLNPTLDQQSDWFMLPYYLKRPVWVDPYVDPDINLTMVTYAYPLFDADSRVCAIATCDLTTDFIWEMVDKNQIFENGSCIILTSDGVIVAHADSSLVRKETIFSIAERDAYIDARLRDQLRILGNTVLEQDSGFMQFRRPHDDMPYWMHFYSIPNTQGTVGVFFSERQLLSELVNIHKINAAMVVVGILLLSIFAWFMAYSIARPLEALSHAATQLAAGNFKVAIPQIKGAREITRLGNAFTRMRDDLQEHIHQLTSITAAREKIASELAIAREIQLGIVPKLFPPFPEHPGVDLFAKLDPALAVGGDLYDFAMLDNNRVYIAIGDVSGKGVPASLLMAVGKTLLKTAIMSYQDPAKALTITNDELAAHNDACMFITIFCAIIDLRNGTMTYVNAGHNPPMIYRKVTGTVEYLEQCHGPATGVLEGVNYTTSKTTLDREDLLLLYTDGVTEAMNKQMEMFSEERLREYMLANGSQPATDFILGLYDTVHEYSAGMDQWDDMTTLAIRGRTDIHSQGFIPDTYEIHLTNQREELARLLSWAETICETFEIPLDTVVKLRLIMEEWFTNILKHAYPDSNRRQQISVFFKRSGAMIEVRFADAGIPFDPTLYTEPPVAETSLANAENAGGLGIRFIRNTVEEIIHRREKEQNINTFVKKILPAADEKSTSFVQHSEAAVNRVEFETADGAMIAHMPQQIDTNTVETIQKQLLKIIIGGHTRLVCDFAKTRYISSAGLRMMLIAARKLHSANGSLKLIGLSKTVREPFYLAGFSTLMEISDE